MTRLNLSYNNLSELPDDFSNLVNMRFLSLNDNKFTKFPSVLLSLKKLETLNLARNKISEIPKNLEEQLNKLVFINLQDNNFTESINLQIGNLI